ncbi:MULTISPECIES: sensor histidine kinase [Halomicrobium]|uniref:histidine kinase n=2 Tax=Halomicrobium mukohataei TaxID=57705 RepID=C7NWM3_HALMD|nr:MULTISPECIES: GAF domain-containing protein [Halomicrobium]ACV48233.1 histidine kinase [Halomicrobium mukohataei DSM 12286]QCD66654.1 histidine kinase [Halomicrobium mukohataei]QFR21460.1 GAF domain-containing protein [Halomicrobium sp. ZPS1]
MSFENQTDFAKQVADLNKYGQALNRCESVDEVVSMTLEAMSLLFDAADNTFVEVRNDDLQVVHSTNPALSVGEAPTSVARRAYESRTTEVASGADARAATDTETTAALAVPATIVDEVTAVLVMRSTSRSEFDDTVVRPMEILASHAATAISNIRSRERLERARQDLETKKEMVELYDRLLRHDLGNDLQVITGFSEVLADEADGETAAYAERINEAAHSSADLIQRVGNLVSTLEEEEEPEPRGLAPILERTVSEAETGYGELTVEFDKAAFEETVYAGDLLESVFTNILTNAVVHNEGEVTVRTSVETGVDDVVVCFADDGAGIDPSVRDELFEMGEKGPDSSGSGFGLGFVRALTESYGGDVTVTESDAGGAEFRVRLQRG